MRVSPSRPNSPSAVAIVGGGLAGAMMAIYLGRRGWPVTVYERHADPRRQLVPGPSMNLGLSRRGIHSLEDVGLLDQVMAELVIPMYGRMIHGPNGQLRFQSYGGETEAIYALKRTELNVALIDFADRFDNVEFAFGHRLLKVDKRARTLRFLRSEGGKMTVGYDLLVGADGVFSAVRHWLQRGERADFVQEYLSWGWKELTIPPAPDGRHRLEKNAFHLWPRGAGMLFAHPNSDGSFTCSLVLPYEGPVSFASLREAVAIRRFFSRQYADVAELVPDLVEQFQNRPVISLMGIRTTMWHFKGDIVLIGDACHAVVPFYAQGMNAAFEDCRVLDDCLAADGNDRVAALARYQALRRRHTDALNLMSRQNFSELRDRVRSPALRLRKQLDAALGALSGNRWRPLHDIVTHTLMPYADAAAKARRQDRFVRWGLAGGSALAALAALHRWRR